MSYFNPAFIDFFTGLKANNNRDWFMENKPTYEKEVKKPFVTFVDTVIDRMREIDPKINIDAKKSVFRIYRDVRFSKDKTPYKPHASAFIARDGKNSHHPGFYFMLTNDRVWLGGGKWKADKEMLHKIRTEIVYSMEEFEGIVNHSDFTSRFAEVSGDKNKIIPAEFREDAKKQPLLANKQFLFNREYDPKIILQDDLVDILMDNYLAGKPFLDFLQRAIDDE